MKMNFSYTLFKKQARKFFCGIKRLGNIVIVNVDQRKQYWSLQEMIEGTELDRALARGECRLMEVSRYNRQFYYFTFYIEQARPIEKEDEHTEEAEDPEDVVLPDDLTELDHEIVSMAVSEAMDLSPEVESCDCLGDTRHGVWYLYTLQSGEEVNIYVKE